MNPILLGTLFFYLPLLKYETTIDQKNKRKVPNSNNTINKKYETFAYILLWWLQKVIRNDFMFITFWTRSLTNVMQILISIHADINIIIKEGISYNNVSRTNSSNH